MNPQVWGDLEVFSYLLRLSRNNHKSCASCTCGRTTWKNGKQSACSFVRFSKATNRYGLQALIEKQSGEFIGQCGLLTQSIDDNTELEIGYHLIRRFWGNGYATEAATVFKEKAFDKHLAGSIISIIDLENISSQKVALRNGMSRVSKAKFMGMDVFIYRIEREAYMKHSR